MAHFCRSTCWKASLAVIVLVLFASSGTAQFRQQRYEPSRPTVSPYLNLFRFNNSVIPNYQSLVRPEQQAQRFKQQQIQLDRQRQQELQRIQASVRVLQQPRVNSELIAPTGKGSWFNVQGGSQFGNTSSFYSRAGTSDAIGTATAR